MTQIFVSRTPLKIPHKKIGLAVVGLLVVILVLNYFKVLPLSQLAPQYLGFFSQPPFQPSVAIIPTPQPLHPMVQKAKSLGYNIIFYDVADSVGRTAFYDKQGQAFNGGIGEKVTKLAEHSFRIDGVTDIFQSFQIIPKSSDKYLILEKPQINLRIRPIRIIINPQDKATSSAELKATQLYIEDLDLIGKSASGSATKLGLIKDFSAQDLQELFQTKDAVSVDFQSVINPKNKQLTILVDRLGHSIAGKVYIRRFGGKSELEKELKRAL